MHKGRNYPHLRPYWAPNWLFWPGVTPAWLTMSGVDNVSAGLWADVIAQMPLYSFEAIWDDDTRSVSWVSLIDDGDGFVVVTWRSRTDNVPGIGEIIAWAFRGDGTELVVRCHNHPFTYSAIMGTSDPATWIAWSSTDGYGGPLADLFWSPSSWSDPRP